ncbi:hypothetical protein QFZ62_000706 [Clavibacter sp. B3I6]|nr:hypothetical protein [Clavibacter sp. B3I6]MDQ0743398.1 hypothetical protein [Clavibacter sp. B3I6]
MFTDEFHPLDMQRHRGEVPLRAERSRIVADGGAPAGLKRPVDNLLITSI